VQSKYLMSNAVDGKIVVWALESKFPKADLAQVRDVEWNKKRATFAWDVIGAWALKGLKETSINAVSVSHDKSLMAVADNLGRVRLFNYPACFPNQASVTIPGHCSHVLDAQFMPKQNILVTIGEKDNAILIWQVQVRDVDTNETLEKADEPLLKGSMFAAPEENLLQD